jgi:trafficking protein particle complex subunit 3
MTEKLAKPNSNMFTRHPNCKPELLCLIYGIYIAKLLKEAPENDAEHVNQELEKMGYNMGTRLIDEFLSRRPHVRSCKDFKTTIETLAK